MFGCSLVDKFSQEKIAPLVREMDEKSQMDPSIIRGLFDNGVGVSCVK